MKGEEKKCAHPICAQAKKDLDKKKLANSLNTIIETLQKMGLYDDDASVAKDLEETVIVLKKIYTYIYNPKSSNLTYTDAKIFVNHLLNKVRNLKKTLDATRNKEKE